MRATHRIPTHPGEILVEGFLRPLGVPQVRFAAHLNIPIQRVNEIATGKRGVTPETALLFGAALGTSPEFWMNLQSAHDLARACTEIGNLLDYIKSDIAGSSRGYARRDRGQAREA